MVFALTACGGGTTPAAPAATEAPTEAPAAPAPEEVAAPDADAGLGTDPVTIKVWLDNEDWAAALMPAFTAKYPNVTVDYEIVGNTDQHGKLTLDGPAGIGADVFMYPHDHVAKVVNDGLAEPIPADYAAKYNAELTVAGIETGTWDGTLYGVPYQWENIALLYNKDLYGDTPPATFEEIIEFAKTYNDPSASKYAMAWQVNDAYHNYHWLSAAGTSVFGPNHDDYKNLGFDGPETAKGLEYYLMMKDTFGLSVADATWDNTVAAFQQGNVPFTISGPWAVADAKNNGINFGVTKLPTIDGNQPWCFSGVQMASVSSYSENMEWANVFVDFLVSPEGAGVLYNTKGSMPTRLDYSEVPGLSEDEYLNGFAEQTPYAIAMPRIEEVNQMWEPLANLFTFTWDGELTIPEAQAKALDTYVTMLAAAGKSID
jgi:arabinogalactan oligomer/maltooligosaccharide transport system substrate-binding protein